LFEQAPGFITALKGPEHVFEFTNATYRRLFGDRNFVGKTVQAAFPELEGQGFFELLDQVYATGERFVAHAIPIRIEAPGAPPQEHFLNFIYQPVMDQTGQVTGIFVEGHDVTEQARAQEALRSSEARLRELNAGLERQISERLLARGRTWQISPELLGVADASGFFTNSNPAWSQMLGWTEEEIARTPLLDFVHPDDRERTRAALEALTRGDPVLRIENRYRCMDGSYRWISWVAVPEGGRFYCSGRDVTAEKEQEAELAKRTAERDRLWRNTQDIQVVIDEAGVFQAVNPAFTHILGWTPPEVIGRTVFDFIVPDDDELTQAALEHARQDALPVVENRYRHKDGGFRWVSWVAAPEGSLIYASGRHITEQKEQAAALALAEEALRQSQKMEAVGQLTGGLAHDFNNLLAGISGSLELMGTRIAQGKFADVERYQVAAQGAAKRAAALTHRLLAFSRRQTLAPKVTDVNGLVAGIEDLIRRTVGPGIAVESALGGGLWSVLVDASQLENAHLNLAINARDAMPEGGKLTIETGNRWLDERSAKTRDLPPGQYVSLSVSDTGTGMPADVVARAFEPFFTTKPIGMSTGLGLSMVYGFARQSSGQVRIYSEVEEGTMVCLYLPRHLGGGAEEEETDAEPGAAVTTGADETVLVIDDEPVVRMLIVDVLEELGYSALEASDGPEGLKVLQSKARVDLLITDVGLPRGLNGRQVADAARVLRPGLKVLFITGYAENAVLNHGHLDHGMQVVTKPFAVDELGRRIRAILSEE
jgi:PAS domain S-box-containing protein